MGMDRDKLSARSKQPGHDRTFLASEATFVTHAQRALDPGQYKVEPNPTDLRRIFDRVGGGRPLGINPEAAIVNLRTERRFFVEVKKQGPGGNAEERACKHHTVQFYKTLAAIYPTYGFHPYVTVMCEDLASDVRYTSKFAYFFEPDQYLLWVNYDHDLIATYLRGRCAAWLG
jgi:hypothetical protein